MQLTMVRCSKGMVMSLLVASAVQAQDSNRADWLRNPAMGNYKGYAEFKMARYAQAREVWQTLAEVGNGDALFNLGILAEDGLGEPADLGKALAFYTQAALRGNFKAQYRLGLLYSVGQRVPKDSDKARLFLSLAAQTGDKDALGMLARLDAPTSPPTPRQQADLWHAAGEHERAARLYATLAAQNDAGAQTRLAWMHEAGQGMPQNLSEAARLFELAAHAGEPQAQYALSVMLRTGRGKDKNMAQSLLWLQRAAAQNHVSAVAALASWQAASPP